MTKEDARILRGLAARVRDFADDPSQQSLRDMWRRHTALKGDRPPVFVSPEGSWREILPDDRLTCADPHARRLEMDLRQRIFRAEHIKDDTPIERTVFIPKAYIPMSDGWGERPRRIGSASPTGAWRHEPIIEKPADWKRLTPVSICFESSAASAAAYYEAASEAVGDILDVSLTGCKVFDFHLIHVYCDFRGLENMLYDLALEPEMVHDQMEFFTQSYLSLIDKIDELGLVDLNNDSTYHYTGAVGYTDELPARGGAEPYHPYDEWGAAEAQEFARVSPEMHEEFALSYERRILDRFGLNGYGCCDDLTNKLEYVKRIKRLRRVGICPWANLESCADQLGKRYIMTWKPNPVLLAEQAFDERHVREVMAESLRQCRHGYVEIVLRDTHTCQNEPPRFAAFVRAAREAVSKVYGETA